MKIPLINSPAFYFLWSLCPQVPAGDLPSLYFRTAPYIDASGASVAAAVSCLKQAVGWIRCACRIFGDISDAFLASGIGLSAILMLYSRKKCTGFEIPALVGQDKSYVIYL